MHIIKLCTFSKPDLYQLHNTGVAKILRMTSIVGIRRILGENVTPNCRYDLNSRGDPHVQDILYSKNSRNYHNSRQGFYVTRILGMTLIL